MSGWESDQGGLKICRMKNNQVLYKGGIKVIQYEIRYDSRDTENECDKFLFVIPTSDSAQICAFVSFIISVGRN